MSFDSGKRNLISIKIQKAIDDAGKAKTINDGIEKCEEVFKLLVANKWYLNGKIQFRKEVKEKLISFKKYWNLSNHYGQLLFPNDPAFGNKPIIKIKPIIEKNKQIDSEIHKCCVCMDQKINAVFMPCQHAHYCYDCANKLNNCAICTGEKDYILKIFTPF
jgi:hypothetical protein